MKQPAHLSTDEETISLRNELYDFVPFTFKQACNETIRRPIRIYSDGVYDLFHFGHAEQLKQAKNSFKNTYIIVGVCSDKDVLKYKGTLPVLTVEERCEMIRHCRYIDEVYKSPPFYPTLEFLNEIKADFVAHDAIPYLSEDNEDCYKIFKNLDRFLPTKRTPSVSTTDILERILDNLEIFQKRKIIRSNIEKTNKNYTNI